jgi:preprotein translocase subunit SecB
MYEAVLMLKAETKLEGKTAYIVELAYGGIFTIPPLPQDQLKFVLMVECPRFLFPYARAIVSDTVRDGGFPQLYLNPIDFAALYQQNQNAQQSVNELAAAPVAGRS